ncbi:hypothetical protein Hte_012216 [Hypoxylon texense]
MSKSPAPKSQMASRPSPPPPPPRPRRPIRRGPPPPPPSAASSARGISGVSVKRLVYTGAFAAVTAVGAIYGAGLKTRQERKQEVHRILEAPPEDRIADLEGRRAALLAQRRPLDAKLADLRARMRAQQEEADKAAAAAGQVNNSTRKPDGTA